MTRDAFEALYRDRAEALLVFFARRTFDPDSALDLWAETWAQAFAGRTRFRGRGDEQAASWLYGIAYRQLAQFRRRGRVERRALERLGLERPAAPDADLERLVELADLAGLRADVRAALPALAPGRREALRLRVVEGLAYPEVARRLGIAEDAARARVSRGLRELERALRPAPVPPTRPAEVTP